MNAPKVEWLKLSTIRERAEAFLSKHHPSRELPIPIDNIVDVKLRMDIVPLSDLKRNLGWDGFLSISLRAIHVDEYCLLHRPTRYNFTLAHEVGHLELHRAIYSSCAIKNLDDYKAFDAALDESQKMWMDWQASRFAGYILVPEAELRRAWAEIEPELTAMVREAKEHNFTPDDYKSYLCEAAGAELCEQFAVSETAMKVRIETAFDDRSLILP